MSRAQTSLKLIQVPGLIIIMTTPIITLFWVCYLMTSSFLLWEGELLSPFYWREASLVMWSVGVRTHIQVSLRSHVLITVVLCPLKGFCACETKYSWVSWGPKPRIGKLGMESLSLSEVMRFQLSLFLSYLLLLHFTYGPWMASP